MRRGFTLIEVLIYSALLASFLGMSFAFVSSILGATDTLLERNEVFANKELVDRKLAWVVGQATSIVSPPASSSSTSQVVVRGTSAVIYPATFLLQSGVLSLSLASATPIALTNNRVTVTQFLAEHFSNTQASSTLRISFSLRSSIFSRLTASSTWFYEVPST